jgi:hypothetical protein
MRIEIFVVTTELDAKHDINGKTMLNEVIRTELIREFGGLTETGTETGYWNDNGEICADSVKRWIIYANTDKSFEEKAQKKQITSDITAFAKRIKKLTAQDSQAFGIDGKLFFV